jgi:hypothetical protein
MISAPNMSRFSQGLENSASFFPILGKAGALLSANDRYFWKGIIQ